MASLDFPPEGAAPCEPESPGDAREAGFSAALLREQYRTLARLDPYINGVVILATVTLCATTQRTSSLLDGMVLPAALLAVSLYRLISWLKARGRVERETLHAIRRKVLAASVFGPAMAFALSLMGAASVRHGDVLELSLALAAVSAVAAASAFCLNALAGAGSLVVVAWAAPLVVALVDRGDGLSLWMAALLTVVSWFVIRMLSENFRIFAEIVRSRFAIAEQQRAAEDARQAAIAMALTDDLTGLPNRRCFFSLLADRIRAGKESAPFAVGLIDLDGFKPINDIHGHAAGDETLRQVAARLAKAIEGRGSAARMGGDEFAVLCDGVGARDEAIALGEEIQAKFATPFAVEALDIRLTGACGFALFPSSASEPDALVRLADAALYRAKAVGPGGVVVFDARAESEAAGRAAQRPSDVSLLFNLSAAQLSAPTTSFPIAATLEEFGLPPTRVEVEASEAAIAKNLEAARATLEALRTAGVRIALDDFGAGASSLGQARDPGSTRSRSTGASSIEHSAIRRSQA
jgi:diguanylate cyclase (GGDEF)-like protein